MEQTAARLSPPPSPSTARARDQRWRSFLPWTAVALLMGVALVHALLVGQRYHVGSFDDDASYVLTARALAGGAGLTSKLASGLPLVGAYPPGYPALLSLLVLIWGHALAPLRALSVVFFLAIFPLTWIYLAERGVSARVRLAVLALLAMSPLLATYGTMIMAEAPFIVLFLLLLLAASRWESEPRSLTWFGAGTVAAAAGLLWLKEAGAGLVIGLVIWFLWRRLWRKALVTAVGPALLFLPVVIARASIGVSLIGSRYSDDLGGSYAGSLVHRLTHTVPHAISTYVGTALPQSVVPTRVSPLPVHGPIAVLFDVVRWTVAPLIIVGFAVWIHRHRDAACVVVPAYLLETLVYPFINERRVILVLPVIMAWYVLGGWTVISGLMRLARTHRSRNASYLLPTVCGLLVIVPLAFQFPRDYLYALHQDSPRPGGSAYMALLRDLGQPHDVVETDYLWTTALYSGHPTANRAFVAPVCDPGVITDAIRQDGAGLLLNAALNKPGLVDNLCILPVAATQPWAVRLYRTARDDASVFELIGPDTGNPLLRDLTAGAQLSTSAATIIEMPEIPQAAYDPAGTYPAIDTAGDRASLTWTLSHPGPVSQVTLGAAAPTEGSLGSLTGVVIESRTIDGNWQAISAVNGPVGDGSATPYVLVRFPKPLMSTALRVTVTGNGTIGIHDLHVLGPA